MITFLTRGNNLIIVVSIAFGFAIVLSLVTGEIWLKDGRVISRREDPEAYWGFLALAAFLTVTGFVVAIPNIFGH